MSDHIIDRDALQKLLNVIGGDPEDLSELLEDFEDQTPKTLAQMKAAADAGDLNALRIASHSLKSNAHDFGAVALAATCAALETACKAGDVADPVARVDTVDTELHRARTALKEVSLGDG